ncbi:MAG: hypothetical protein GXP29_15820 [Planctomycetes bacterium]|nr:hypothetical protein [Planctomycetota bacterium]
MKTQLALSLLLLTIASGCHRPKLEVTQMDVPGIVNLHRAGDVFVSGVVDDTGLAYLQSEGVTEIIDLRRAEEFDPSYAQSVKSAGIGYHHIPMMSNGLTDEQAEQFLTTMDTVKGKRILLQCASANRSGGMYGLYLASSHKCEVDEAMEQAKAAGLRHPDLIQAVRLASKRAFLQKRPHPNGQHLMPVVDE